MIMRVEGSATGFWRAVGRLWRISFRYVKRESPYEQNPHNLLQNEVRRLRKISKQSQTTRGHGFADSSQAKRQAGKMNKAKAHQHNPMERQETGETFSSSPSQNCGEKHRAD
jgi:hypothetical protein